MAVVTFNTIQIGAKRTSLVARIAHFIKLFAKSPSNWISLRIAANIMHDTKFIEQQITLVKQMDDEQVKKGMAFIQSMLPELVKMDNAIEKIQNPALSIAFRQHELAVYDLEAKLHLKQTEHLPVIPTDPELREALHYATVISLNSHL
ncbi:hypothetical protein J2Y45_005803 [Dyadobacter sp. BE34]|uniref:Uncharacterized protein n=1 Tax=Dyadobacter fermentans TaxID=94254 RepID=A0ABU1R5B7_9BACT|nr:MULTISPECIES: hypothetical protein [Dyadobacter]MDR6808591.1 hypothetical protein [Dyadobacter fermentans]MDR7046334.1 hypothetical protein [Dyadobacter sp. BE242]MDR7200647.1 hypothetical protein [Dyadobacter sp. BE34]MDR7218607.1 hypothetical protein [Dyadobacter sp. BE31]MDR7266537.1 hypothetical protein [Dyadobacter sp. BE32]